MPGENKTQEQIEEEAYNEAALEIGEEDKDVKPEEPPEKVAGKEAEKKEGEETAEKPPEGAKEGGEPDWKAEKAEFQAKLNKAEQERDANKRFADEQARRRAEAEKKLTEKEKEKEEEELETPPEEVAAYLEEYPEAEPAINFFAKKGIKAGIEAYHAKLTEACGGEDPAIFIPTMIERVNQMDFERTVMIGYYDDSGKHVPGHPDIVTITHDPEFHKYTEGKIKDDPSLKAKLNDPVHTIKFVSEYKDSQIEKAAEKDKKKQKEQKEEIDEQISGADKDVTKKGPKKESDPNDEEQAYRDGVKAIEQL